MMPSSILISCAILRAVEYYGGGAHAHVCVLACISYDLISRVKRFVSDLCNIFACFVIKGFYN